MNKKTWILFKVSIIISLAISLLLFSRGIYTEIIKKIDAGDHIGNAVKLVLVMMTIPIIFQSLNIKLSLHYLPKGESPSPKFRLWHRIFFYINSIVVLLMLASIAYRIYLSFPYYKQTFMIRGFKDIRILSLLISIVGYTFNIIATILSLKILTFLKRNHSIREEEMLNKIGTQEGLL